MKKLLITGAALALFIPFAVSAHVLMVSGSMAGLLHIDPNDAPQVGTPATFHLQLKNSAQPSFTLQSDYGLDITIANGTGVTAEILPVGWKYVGTGEVDFKYTFTKKGSYTLKVLGIPKKENLTDFDLSYPLNVGVAVAADHTNDVTNFNAFGATSTAVTSDSDMSPTMSDDAMGAGPTGTLQMLVIIGGILLALALIFRDQYLRRKSS